MQKRNTFGRKKNIGPSDQKTISPTLVSYIERRERGTRKVQLKRVKLIFNNGFCTSDAILRSISENGARIQTDDVIDLPDMFTMVGLYDELHVKCRRVWRNASSIGVEFVSET